MGAKIPLVDETKPPSQPQRGPSGLSLQCFSFIVTVFSFQSHLAIFGLYQ